MQVGPQGLGGVAVYWCVPADQLQSCSDQIRCNVMTRLIIIDCFIKSCALSKWIQIIIFISHNNSIVTIQKH